MPRLLIAPAFLVACGLLAGCGNRAGSEKAEEPKSDNEGVIVGKWKIVSAPGWGEKEQQIAAAFGIYGYSEFKSDGTLTFGAASANPEQQKLLDSQPENRPIICKYRLLPGDGVEFFDLPKNLPEGVMFGANKDPTRVTVRIEKDEMTMMSEDKKTSKFTRVKETKDKDKPEKK